MAGSEESIDIATAALLIAAEEYPGLDPPIYLHQLDELADRATRQVSQASAWEERVAGLNQRLFVDEGFVGNSAQFDDRRNSFLNEVLERRTGIPITLCLVYTEVAQRLGLDARGVGFPGHFLAKVVGDDGREIVVDAFGGRVLTEDDCRALWARVAGPTAPWRAALHLRSATPRETLVRMLSNLKQLAFRDRDFERALSCCDRILLVTPESPLELRDRGLVYEQLGWSAAAAADLVRFLELVPDDPSASAVRERLGVLRRAVGRLH